MCSEKAQIRIGARQSDLSKIQCFKVGETLLAAHKNLKVDYHFKEASGDLDQLTSLAKFGGKGVFTQDLTSLLLNGEVDMVVHSYKDLPTEPNQKTEIAGTLPREDMRDLLLIRKDKVFKGCNIDKFIVLSSSPRRTRNIGLFLPTALPFKTNKIIFNDIRGNVPTRLKKLLAGDAHALVVAKAAIERFLKDTHEEFSESRETVRSTLKNCYSMVLPLRENPCAPAQGALAIEIRKDDKDTKQLIDAISSCSDFACASKEREILSSYGGGCHQKIGVASIKKHFGDLLFVQGETSDGKDLFRSELTTFRKIPKASKGNIWPETKEEGRSVFLRENIEVKNLPSDKPLWISRDTALPENLEPNWDTPVWCAGSETWKKLASRGVFVNGSSENLGESEDPRFDLIAGKKLDWVKLTHTEGLSRKVTSSCQSGFLAKAGNDQESKVIPTNSDEVVYTYKLIPSESLPNLSGKTHFFWMSGSQFLYLLQKFPEIKDGYHSCGPGHTATIISRTLSDRDKLFVYLSYEDWKKEVV